MWVVRGSMLMLPRLAAEEAFAVAEQVAIGTGCIDRDDAKRVTARWLEAAHRTAVKPKKIRPEMLRAFGIGFQIVEGSSAT